MTPTPPDEAIHFRGETLTPESPRPLHVPEPSNIPVLLNQMDPVFNDTSTYQSNNASDDHSQMQGPPVMDHRSSESVLNGQHRDVAYGGLGSTEAPDSVPLQDTGSFRSTHLDQDNQLHKDAVLPSVFTNIAPICRDPLEAASCRNSANSALTLPLPDSVPLPKIDPLHNPDASHAMLSAALQNPLTSYVTDVNPPNPAVSLQPNPPPNMHHGAQEQHVGVDFQTLFNNLAPPPAANPAANPAAPPAPPAPAPAPAGGASAPISPIDASMRATATTSQNTAYLPSAEADSPHNVAASLPPRPPLLQESSPMYPLSYTSSETLHPLSQLSAPNSLSQQPYTSQQTNYQSAGAPAPFDTPPGAAPGASSGASGLPPPPVATFQQQSTSQAPVVSPALSPRQSAQQHDGLDRLDRLAGRDELVGDDDAPWGPEVQQKYDEFLHDERVYVSEGHWDRFPPGSRLFVG
jgi:hypothetical protein